MPRDSLGRIVYVGDVIGNETTVAEVGMSYTIVVAHPSGVSTALIASFVAVDLAASPERTNHERYFADLGTREEVYIAACDICVDSRKCSACVLNDWHETFGAENGMCLSSFNRWLDERAVV